MDKIEFDEEKYLKKSPGYVFRFKKPSILHKFIPRAKTAEERNTLILLIIFAIILFGSTAAILLRENILNKGKMIDPEPLSAVEKFKLPEAIRMYVK